MFEAEGYVVFTAETAEKAIELLAGARPDLILSDVKLPGMDGFSLYDHVRGVASMKDIPFMFITGYNDPLSISRVMKLGPVAYVTKPYNLEDLMTMVRSNIHRPA
jgi:chemosensory pili system protein ChpA (sensor histidine kinase/response regulator)